MARTRSPENIQYSLQKAALTRAIKKGHAAVVAATEKVIDEWAQFSHGWPDDWSRWQCALDDTYGDARTAYIRGEAESMPAYVDMDDLRFRRACERLNAAIMRSSAKLWREDEK